MMRRVRAFLIEWAVLVVLVSSTAAIVDFAFVALGRPDTASFITMPGDFLPVAAALFLGLVVWRVLAPHKDDQH